MSLTFLLRRRITNSKMSEYMSEQERSENGNLSRDCPVLTLEVFSIRALVDRLAATYPHNDLSDSACVEKLSVEEAV